MHLALVRDNTDIAAVHSRVTVGDSSVECEHKLLRQFACCGGHRMTYTNILSTLYNIAASKVVTPSSENIFCEVYNGQVHQSMTSIHSATTWKMCNEMPSHIKKIQNQLLGVHDST